MIKQIRAPFFLLLSVFFIPTFTYSQSSFSKRHSDVISYKDSIDHLSDTTLQTLTNGDFTKEVYDSGSQLKGIYSRGKLIKIEVWFGLSYGINTRTYYLKNDKLLLATESFKGYHYDKAKTSFDYTSFDISHEGWYLFVRDKLIDQESLGHWRFEDDELDAEKVLMEEFNRYTLLLDQTKE